MMDVRTGGPILHGVFCALAGVLFIAFFITAALGPAWWDAPTVYRVDSWFSVVLLLVGVGLLFQLVLGIWVGVDASRRGMNGFLWGALTCFTCVVGLIVYLISAQSSPPQAGTSRPGSRDDSRGGEVPCPDCGSPTRGEFLACPFCGLLLRRSCPECGRATEPAWRFCSYCKASLGENPVPKE